MVMLNKNNLFVHKVMVEMVGRKICSMGGNKMLEEEGRERWTKISQEIQREMVNRQYERTRKSKEKQ